MKSWKCQDPAPAYRRFLDRANQFVQKLMNAGLPPEIEESILAGESGKWIMGDLSIELICSDSSLESKYEMTLIVRQR